MASSSFPFIVSNGPKLQRDPSIRTMIRKQAMKDIGQTRRKRSSKGKRAVPHPSPVSTATDTEIQSTTSPEATSETTSAGSSSDAPCTDESEYDELLPLAPKHHRLPDPFTSTTLSTSYELARANFGVDVADLSMLTNFNVGRGVISILGAESSNLATLLSSRQWSYMEFVPSRYGYSACLTAATDCVLAKVRSVLAPQTGQDDELVLRLYSKALKALQAAISDETLCMDADVLCATELLSLHELLDPGRQSAWDQHIYGSMRLVRSRSPKRFQTEFEKALFAAHVGPSISAALLENTSCYLARPEWLELYRSLEVDTTHLTDRSPLTINVRSRMLLLPGLWQDVDAAIKSDGLFDDETLKVLATRCRNVQHDLLAWTEEYKNHCVRLSLVPPPPHELMLRRELFGLSLECLVLVKRLLATVCEDDREQLEMQVQALANLLLDLQKQPASKHSWLFSGHEVGIAYTIHSTKEQWEGDFSYTSNFERKIACRNRYAAWSAMLRSPAE